MDRLIAPNSVIAAQADTAPATGTPQFATDGNPATDVPATQWPAYQYNAIQEELIAILAAASIAPDRTKNNQVVAAIKRLMQSTVVLADTGAVNAYAAVNPTPLVGGGTPTWVDGIVQAVKIAHTNTGASTYAPDGLPAIPIYGLGLQPLQGGELLLNGTAILMRTTIAGVNSGNPICVLMECTGGAQQVPPATQSQHAMQLGQATGRLLNVQVFNAAGSFTYTPTPGATTAIADVQGAGGQGGGSAACAAGQNSFGTGGHSGSRAVVRFSLSGVSTLACTVGAGGTTGAVGASGQTGGTSSLGTLASCPGGAGGNVLGPTTASFIGGNAAALPLASIGAVLQTISIQGGNAGQSALCIAVGTAISGTGGISPGYSGGIVGVAGTGVGSPGTQVGQGGSGAFTAASGAAQVGGAGIHGQVTIYEYA